MHEGPHRTSTSGSTAAGAARYHRGGSRAARPAGLFRGVQTLRQLFPAGIEARQSAIKMASAWSVPPGRIEDRPRYAWRGAMLDVARHFFTVDEVKQYVDLLALYKLNVLHLHLSDDQGWRIRIDAWPRLTEVGGSTQVGGGPGGFHGIRSDRRATLGLGPRSVRQSRTGSGRRPGDGATPRRCRAASATSRRARRRRRRGGAPPA